MTACAGEEDRLRGLLLWRDLEEVVDELVELRRPVLLDLAGVGEVGDEWVDRDPREERRARGDDQLQALRWSEHLDVLVRLGHLDVGHVLDDAEDVASELL